MNSREVRERYLKYFEKNGHTRIDPAPLVLPNDPTTLFTSSGMQPLVPYLMGQAHPKGKRLVDSQPSIRLQDIEEVGDNRHTTFFEMLGNWSLGDYFKSEQLAWVFDFLVNKEDGLGLDPNRIFVSVYEGDSAVEKDFASIDIWKNIFESLPEPIEAKLAENIETGLQNGARIFAYPAKKNWWSRSGTPDEMPPGEIGGPDSEVFYDFGEERGFHENSQWKDEACHPNCDCGRFMEIGNSVFIQYKKKEDGGLEELPQKNVDFGGGLERLVAATADEPDVFKTDFFEATMKTLVDYVKVSYGSSQKTDISYRIVAEHLRAASYLIAQGVLPGNKLQGYIVRRLIRRAVFRLKLLGFDLGDGAISTFAKDYANYYEVVGENWYVVKDALNIEAVKFSKALDRGMKVLMKMVEEDGVDGKTVFDLYQTEGFPLELTLEILEQNGKSLSEDDKKRFQQEFDKHKDSSRTATAGTFKGGLADSSEIVTRYHTATHLLLASLRRVLGEHVVQKGQNITAERSRFDFSHEAKLTEDQLKEVEELINEMIAQDLPVQTVELSREEAESTGAVHAFNERYGETVTIYYVGDSLETAFSKEFCGGPHVTHTGAIGRVRIKKQEKIGDGVIRIYLEFDNS